MSLSAADSLAVADLLRQAAAWVLRSGCEACVLAGLVLVAQRALRGRISARWRYNLWLLVVARLVLPGVPGVGVSPFNLMPRVTRIAIAPPVGAPASVSASPAVAAASAAALDPARTLTSTPLPERTPPTSRPPVPEVPSRSGHDDSTVDREPPEWTRIEPKPAPFE